MPGRKEGRNRVDHAVAYGPNNKIDYFEFNNGYNEEYITISEIKHRGKSTKLTLPNSCRWLIQSPCTKGPARNKEVRTPALLFTCFMRDQCSPPAVRLCQLEPCHARDVRCDRLAIECVAGGRWSGSCLGQAELPAVEEGQRHGEQVGEDCVEGHVVQQLRHALREAWVKGR